MAATKQVKGTDASGDASGEGDTLQQSCSDSAAGGLTSAASKGGVDLGRLSAPQLGRGKGGVDLQRYQELQKHIALLQGLQIKAQVFQQQRRASALAAQIESMQERMAEAQQGVQSAQATYDRLSSAQRGWYLGKLMHLLLPRKDAKLVAASDSLEAASEQLRQREAQASALQAQQEEALRCLAQWQAEEAELAAAQQEVAELERSLFGSSAPGTPEASQERQLLLLDALCAMEAPSEEGDGSEDGSTHQGLRRLGPLRLLRMVSSVGAKMIRLPGRKPEGSGSLEGAPSQPQALPARLLRISLQQLQRAAQGQELEVEVEADAEESIQVEVEGQALQVELTDVPEDQEEHGEQEGSAAEQATAGPAAQPAAAGQRQKQQRAPASPPPGQQGKAQPADLREPVAKGASTARLLRGLADRLGKGDESKGEDQYGRMFRGRLLRIAADKMAKAAEARRREKDAALVRLEKVIGVHGKQKLGIDPSLMHLFPKDACNFNPAIHCPPSTFLWLYPSRFMGKVQRLQTGPVLQAYHRFGPFDADPSKPRRLIPRAPDGPPLLLLSGIGSTMISWGVPLLRALAACHEVIIMEYRGAGLSKNMGEEPWNYYNQAEAVLMLADALKIPKFNWLGWSSGGNTGLVLAALHGDRLQKMVSHAGMAGGPNTIVPPAYACLNPDMSLSLGQTMALIFPPDDPKGEFTELVTPDDACQICGHTEFRATCGRYIKDVFSMPGAITDQEVSPAAAREQWVADQEFIHNDGRVWDALPQANTPTLIMNGDKDVLVPFENAERIAARLPNARLHKWEGWGHGFKDAAAFAAIINEFLCAE